MPECDNAFVSEPALTPELVPTPTPPTCEGSEADAALTPTPTPSPNPMPVEARDPAAWKVLRNGRLGYPLPHIKGKQTYLAVDGRTRLCEHGETASAIATYMRNIRPIKGCPCLNMDGLMVGRYATAPVGWKTPPVNYYDVLCANGAPWIVLAGGREARQLPHTAGDTPLYMLQSGNLRCAHGNSETTLRTQGQSRVPKHACSCRIIGKRSWRQNRLQNQVGKRVV